MHDHLRAQLAELVRAVGVALSDARRAADAALFPDLAQADDGLRPVLTRLSHEHVVLHEVLVRLDDLLVDLVHGRAEATAALGALEEGLLSHVAYEEGELLDAIRRLGVRV